jgi:hypothetical protein
MTDDLRAPQAGELRGSAVRRNAVPASLLPPRIARAPPLVLQVPFAESTAARFFDPGKKKPAGREIFDSIGSENRSTVIFQKFSESETRISMTRREIDANNC